MSAVPGCIVKTYSSSFLVALTGRATAGIGRSRWNGSNGTRELRAQVRARLAARSRRALVEVEGADQGEGAGAVVQRRPPGHSVTFPVHQPRPLPFNVIVRVAVVVPIGPASLSVSVTGNDCL